MGIQPLPKDHQARSPIMLLTKKQPTLESDYVSSAFQKLTIANNRAVINAEGKIFSILV